MIESRSVTVNFGLTAPSSVIDMDPPAVTFQCTLITIIDDTRRREDCKCCDTEYNARAGMYKLLINLCVPNPL